MRTLFLYLCVLVLLLSLSGCSAFRRNKEGKPGVQLSTVRELPHDIRTVPFVINRETFAKTLVDKRLLWKLRLVPVYKRGSTKEGALPEYRLFDILPESPYAMLGLQPGDVLLAADDWVVFDTRRFMLYVELLSKLNEGKIEIRRKGQPMMLKYTFIPEVKESAKAS